ncbi:MAG: phenol degradation protein meta [Thiobacillus sp.]|nr:phenol degradation protein meta [Thiobacillus sp.]
MNTELSAFDAVHPVGVTAVRPMARLLVRLPLCPQRAGRMGKAAKAATTPLSRLLDGVYSLASTEVIRHQMPRRKPIGAGTALLLAAALVSPDGRADEGGSSFWLPGQFASMAAVPPTPGWSLNLMPYYYSGRMVESRILPQGRIVSSGNDTQLVLLNVQPGYAPETRILGGQGFIGLGFGVGNERVRADNSISIGSLDAQSDVSGSDNGGTDLSPYASLAWADGVYNWMVYLTGNIPVGSYDSQRLANIGLGHGAIDAGGGYTYFSPQSGREFSAVLGFTSNLENHHTDYKSGVDSHLDWSVSQAMSSNWLAGLAGYVYYQLSADRYPTTGALGELQFKTLGSFKSRVAAIGPQLGCTFDFNGGQGSLDVRGYWEFWAQNRPEGYALFATLGIPLSD